jgi:carboxypeptidase T
MQFYRISYPRSFMKLRMLIFLFSFITFAHNHESFSEQKSHIISLASKNIFETVKHYTDRGYEVTGVNYNEGIVDIYVTQSQLDELYKGNKAFYVKFVTGISKKPDPEYKNPQQIEKILLQHHQEFPDLTKLISIGKSLEGRDIWAIKISHQASEEDNQKPNILFNSMHHAREVMSPEVSLDIIEYLLTQYQKNPEVKNWVDNAAIYVLPMLNVDGNNKMWVVDSMWRKNTRDGHGVDINRNYPYAWNTCNGSSGTPGNQSYRGPAPASEPETNAMMNFVASIEPVFNISYHAYSELVIYPLGCKGERTQTAEVVETIGKDLANVLKYKAGTAWELLYSVDGGDIDWMYEAYKVIPYVIELNSTLQGFHPSYKRWRDKTVERNRPAWQMLIKKLFTSGVRGLASEDYTSIEVYHHPGQKLIWNFSSQARWLISRCVK